MDNNNKGKVIRLIIRKDVDDKKTTNSSDNSAVVDIRKNQISKMIDDLVSLNKKNEDLLEG